MNETEFLSLPDGTSIAYRHLPGSSPGILFCAGFHSNMQGVKALELERCCREQGRQFTRFDYFGHGESSGAAQHGCIGRWRDDTLAVLDQVTSGPQLVVGSFMILIRYSLSSIINITRVTASFTTDTFICLSLCINSSIKLYHGP